MTCWCPVKMPKMPENNCNWNNFLFFLFSNGVNGWNLELAVQKWQLCWETEGTLKEAASGKALVRKYCHWKCCHCPSSPLYLCIHVNCKVKLVVKTKESLLRLRRSDCWWQLQAERHSRSFWTSCFFIVKALVVWLFWCQLQHRPSTLEVRSGRKKSSPTQPRPTDIKARPGPSPIN